SRLWEIGGSKGSRGRFVRIPKRHFSDPVFFVPAAPMLDAMADRRRLHRHRMVTYRHLMNPARRGTARRSAACPQCGQRRFDDPVVQYARDLARRLDVLGYTTDEEERE